MTFRQQTANCADFDVTTDGDLTPSFRMLLPEHVRADGFEPAGALHVIPGTWQTRADAVTGEFRVGEELMVSVRLEPLGCFVRVDLSFRNVGHRALCNLTANICTAVNHLPGVPGWCNRSFMPTKVPLDREVQGRYWYERTTPGRLVALTESGWVGMHPDPGDPDADKVPLYGFTPSPRADATACALGSIDGKTTFYQSWKAQCYYCTPCPGNACMHLEPLVTGTLAQGGQSTISGEIGMHEGGIESLAARLRRPGHLPS